MTPFRSLFIVLAFGSHAVFACESGPSRSEVAKTDAPASRPPPAPLPVAAPGAQSEPAQVRAPADSGATPSPLPTAIAAQHVLIQYRGAERGDKSIRRTKSDARDLAQKVADEAKRGSDFTELVNKYSEDPGAKERLGSLGKFTPDKMHKAFSDAAFLLKVDETSGVVETPFGFHVIKRNQ